jgi:hypothetical protein
MLGHWSLGDSPCWLGNAILALKNEVKINMTNAIKVK